MKKQIILAVIGLASILPLNAMALQSEKVLRCYGESRLVPIAPPDVNVPDQVQPVKKTEAFYIRPDIDQKNKIAEIKLELPALKVLIRATSEQGKESTVYATWEGGSAQGKDLSLSFNSIDDDGSKFGHVNCKIINKK